MLFFVLAGAIGIWCAAKDYVIYRSVLDTLPPEFQDYLQSRYAFPVYVLEPSTPLPMQFEHLKTLCGACAALLCISFFFSSGNIVFGVFILLGFLWGVFHTTKSWKTYKENCARAESQRAREQR